MDTTPNNDNSHELEQAALQAVNRYRSNDSFDPRLNYTIDVDKGTLQRLHGGGRGDVYALTFKQKRYCLKYFHDNRLIARLRNGLGMSKASLSQKTSHSLQQLKINAPKVLSVIQPTRFSQPLLIMEMLDDYQQLNLMLLNLKETTQDICQEPTFKLLIHTFAAFTDRLHDNNVLHQDFSPRNILVRRQKKTFDFYIIDLEDIHYGTNFKSDLDHFNARLPRYLSATECDFFLKEFQHIYNHTQG